MVTPRDPLTFSTGTSASLVVMYKEFWDAEKTRNCLKKFRVE